MKNGTNQSRYDYQRASLPTGTAALMGCVLVDDGSRFCLISDGMSTLSISRLFQTFQDPGHAEAPLVNAAEKLPSDSCSCLPISMETD